jgi:hypothetical protein
MPLRLWASPAQQRWETTSKNTAENSQDDRPRCLRDRRQALSEGCDSVSGWGEDYCEE